jgi:hypothetical protein
VHHGFLNRVSQVRFLPGAPSSVQLTVTVHARALVFSWTGVRSELLRKLRELEGGQFETPGCRTGANRRDDGRLIDSLLPVRVLRGGGHEHLSLADVERGADRAVEVEGSVELSLRVAAAPFR